jgi:hypothetical protein
VKVVERKLQWHATLIALLSSPSCFEMAVEQDTQDTIYDSLPYYDKELEEYPELREIVDKEFQKGAKKPPNKLHPKVPPEITLFAVRTSSFCPFVLDRD